MSAFEMQPIIGYRMDTEDQPTMLTKTWTAREHIAVAAMSTILTWDQRGTYDTDKAYYATIAKHAFKCADAMLAHAEKEQK